MEEQNQEQKNPKEILAEKIKEGLREGLEVDDVLEDFSFDEPKTKQMASVLKALALDGKKTLLLVPKSDRIVVKSGRNIPSLSILEANKASTYDIVDCHMLVIQKSAVGVLQNTFKN